MAKSDYFSIAYCHVLEIKGVYDREEYEWVKTTGIFGKPLKKRVIKKVPTEYVEDFVVNEGTCRHHKDHVSGFRVDLVTPEEFYEIDTQQNFGKTVVGVVKDMKFVFTHPELGEKVETDTIFRLLLQKGNGTTYYYYYPVKELLIQALKKMDAEEHYNAIMKELKFDGIDKH